MNKQRRGTADATYCLTDGDTWTVKQHHWKSEAKKDHQLSPGGPSNRRRAPVPHN